MILKAITCNYHDIKSKRYILIYFLFLKDTIFVEKKSYLVCSFIAVIKKIDFSLINCNKYNIYFKTFTNYQAVIYVYKI